MSQNNSRIRIATSDPKLQSKITVDISGSIENIYWYIRFNIPLDAESVSENTMEVTDTDGYIMRTDISYQAAGNRIVISPFDSYEDQRYYLLKISKKVRSAKGQNLKTVISILFKLYQGSISEYKVLRKDVPVPPSRPRPKNYDEIQKNRKPNYLDNYSQNAPIRTKMKTESLGMNIWLGLVGLVLTGAGVAIEYIPLIIGALVLSVAGVAHIFLQWQRREFRSKICYNRGVRFFNRMQFDSARRAFEKAIEFDPNNQLANYAISRVGIYK